MSQEMFRKEALGKLASPEQLDELMKVTTPRGWLALFALCAIVVAAVVWGIFGRVPTRVVGQGMLIRPGGVFSVPSNGQGPVARLLVEEGDMVKAGDVIAEITQVDLVAQIAEARSERESLASEHKKVLEYCQKQLKTKMEYYEAQRKDLGEDIASQQSLVVELQKLVKGLEGLRRENIASETEVMQSRQNLIQAQSQVRSLDDQRNSIPGNEADTNYTLEQKRFDSEKAVDDVDRNIQLLETRLKTASKVISPYSGRVLEVMVDEGTVVNVGTSILSVEMLDQAMEAVVFVSDMEGKRVAKGMRVEITPATVKREEYGFMIGTVESVSEFPATQEGMMRLLQNQSLVQQLSQKGVPIQVNASLMSDDSTPSGFKWSSRKGPKLKITSGTFCTGNIVTMEQPPVTLVIPFLKKFFGLT